MSEMWSAARCLLSALLFAASTAVLATDQAERSKPNEPDAGSNLALRSMFLLQDVRLRQHPSCKSVGSHASDRTVGHYLAGFMGFMQDGNNRVEAQCVASLSDAVLKRCTVWLKHADSDDEWAWGLQFDVDRRSRPIKSSVRCLGGG